MRIIQLRDITTIGVDGQLQIREIRNSPSVRQWMYTDHEISVNEHLAWIARLKVDTKQIVFAVFEDGHPVGIASFNAVDRQHKKSDWAFYLSDEARGGLGACLELAMIEYAFGQLGLEKLNCEVIDGNSPVVKLHSKFGFREEGFREQNIIKGGQRVGVHFLGLRKDQWRPGEVRRRFEDHFAKFNIIIEPPNTEQSALDRIEAARAKNNVNWMTILRIALDKSPQTAAPVVASIQALDKEINGITHDLMAQLQDDENLPGYPVAGF